MKHSSATGLIDSDTVPEGVIRGESVPTENEEYALEQAKIEELAGFLNSHPAYHELSRLELYEIARERLDI